MIPAGKSIALAILLLAPCTGRCEEAPAASADVAPSCPYRPTHAGPLAMSAEDYPLLSAAQGEQGTVVLDFLIRPDGFVGDIRVARSSGFARLDGAAVDAAALRWRFDPVLVDGKPISCRYRLAVVWHLAMSPQVLARQGLFVVHPAPSDYPPGSLARREQGLTVIWASVSPAGKFLTTRTGHSAGFADLDQAGIKLVRTGKWPVTPATVSGKPGTTGVGFAIVWSPDGR